MEQGETATAELLDEETQRLHALILDARQTENLRKRNDAFGELLKLAKPTIKSTAARCRGPNGVTEDEIESIAGEILFQCVQTYDFRHAFFGYYHICLRCRLFTAIKEKQQWKRLVNYKAKSLHDDPLGNGELSTILEDPRDRRLHFRLEDREALAVMMKTFMPSLSGYEYLVLKLVIIEGQSYEDAANTVTQTTGEVVDVKGIDNAMSRIKRKLADKQSVGRADHDLT